MGLLGESVLVGAILKPFSTAPSYAARGFPNPPVVCEVDAVGLGMLPAVLSWRMKCC